MATANFSVVILIGSFRPVKIQYGARKYIYINEKSVFLRSEPQVTKTLSFSSSHINSNTKWTFFDKI